MESSIGSGDARVLSRPKDVVVGDVRFANDAPLVVIGGVNVLEDVDSALKVGETFRRETARLGLSYVFKASFDKANRSSADSGRGPGPEVGLRMLAELKAALDVPVVTDVHLPDQCAAVAEVADIIQVPAFLVRQTDLVASAAATGRALHLKKMQMMSPRDMANVVAKCERFGNERLLLCERGTAFGYSHLVVDFVGLAQLKELGYPVSVDVTHALQTPGSLGTSTGGRGEYAQPLSLAAASQAIAALFIESHVDLTKAPCDGASATPLAQVGMLLRKVKRIDDLVKASTF